MLEINDALDLTIKLLIVEKITSSSTTIVLCATINVGKGNDLNSLAFSQEEKRGNCSNFCGI